MKREPSRLPSFLIGAALGMQCASVAVRCVQSVRAASRPAQPVTRNAQAYGRLRRGLFAWDLIRSTAELGAFAFGAPSRRIARLVPFGNPLARVASFSALAVAAGALLELPTSYIEDFNVERRFGLSDQRTRTWLAERAKESAVMLALMPALTTAFAVLLRTRGSRWPLAAWLATAPLFVALAVAGPTYIAPLFNKFEPLSGELERRLRLLGMRYGVGDAALLRVDMSRQTKKANAYVTGVFRTRRIVVGDTLLSSFPPEEIEFVVAHELGHYVAKDTWRLIALAQLATGLVYWLAEKSMRREDDAPHDDPIAIARLYFFITLFGSMLRPLQSAFARSREWAADRFAVEATGAPLVGADAFERLREQNLAEPDQPLWMELLFASHPSLGKRIAALRAVSL